MTELTKDDCDEILFSSGSSLTQLLALQLKKEFNKVKELEEENLRLRQQRDAANAQIDFILENINK